MDMDIYCLITQWTKTSGGVTYLRLYLLPGTPAGSNDFLKASGNFTHKTGGTYNFLIKALAVADPTTPHILLAQMGDDVDAMEFIPPALDVSLQNLFDTLAWTDIDINTLPDNVKASKPVQYALGGNVSRRLAQKATVKETFLATYNTLFLAPEPVPPPPAQPGFLQRLKNFLGI